MSRFGRKETFISSHYAHGYPSSPVGFHPLQPLNWGPFIPYGAQPAYGWSPISYNPVTGRYTRTKLAERKANVSTYDHYDAIQALLKTATAKKAATAQSAEELPSWNTFTDEVASNDSAANLKTAYLLIVAGLQLQNKSLGAAGKQRAEAALISGVVEGAANQRKRIESIYSSALSAVQKAAGSSPKQTVADIITQLQRGSASSVVQERIATVGEQEAVRQKAKQELADQPCESTWLGKIPGYCTAQTAYKIVGYGALAAAGLWVTARVIRGARGVQAAATQPVGNPYVRSLTVRGNPSSAANMGSEPELDIALTPKGRQQERQLANRAFKRVRSN